MNSWLDLGSRFTRACVAAVLSIVLWTFWLALTLLLFFQLYIITANELSIPDVVLRRIEDKLAESGIRATFSRTSFDPAGRVLVENVQLSVPAFTEPLVTCRSVFVRLNPWLLVVGRFEPREVRLHGVTAFVPAMLSPTGQPEEIVTSLDTSFEPRRRAVVLEQLSARVAGVPISASGTIALVPGTEQRPALDRVREFLATRFTAVCRQALVVADHVKAFDEPTLRLQFTPSESGATGIEVHAMARRVKLTKPLALEAASVQASTRLLLFGETPPTSIHVTASELRLPDETHAVGIDARIVGRVRRDAGQFELREVAVTTDRVQAQDIDVVAASALVFPRPLPALHAEVTATVAGSPLAIRAQGNVATREGVVRFEGQVSPRVLDLVSRRTSTNVRRFFDFDALTAERAEARFAAGGRFEQLTARIRIPRLNAYGVPMENGRVEVTLDPTRLSASRAFARVGENFAEGSYEHDLKSNAYRFLLEGRLRPQIISRWFRDWWSNFFQQLEFPADPPAANVDVRGVWRDGSSSNVFVFADVPKATVRGTPLERVRTRIFIRPAFFDGLELLAIHEGRRAQGRFTYVGDPATHAWHTLELSMDSTLGLDVTGRLLGPAGARAFAPFRLAEPPQLKVRGSFAGPAAPGGEQEKLRIEARTTGEFRFHDFPLRDVSFIATIDRDEIVLDDIEALFGGGAAGGHARVWGKGDQRRLGFDLALEDASLGNVAAGLAEFFAARKGTEPGPPGKFVQEKANVRLNFAASAEGRYDDPLSYRGDGSALLRGAEIGEVPLLGMLSELLKFTRLRFTEARANFRIEGPKVVFPEVTLRGSNSAIDAHGAYVLDRRELDFNAKIFPFQESENVLKTVVGAVLSPLSNALEVKLTGSITKPEWAFVMGPTNLLRSLSGSPEPKPEQTPAGKDAGSAAQTNASQFPPADRSRP